VFLFFFLTVTISDLKPDMASAPAPITEGHILFCCFFLKTLLPKEIRNIICLFLAGNFSFKPSCTLKLQFGSYGQEMGDLSQPWGVRVSPNKQIIVSDQSNHRISIFDFAGKCVRVFGKSGTGPGELSSPRDIALDSKSNIFVADTGNHRIQCFSPEGKHIFHFGSRGKKDQELISPYCLTISSEDHIFVTEWGNHRVQVFDKDGKYLFKFGQPGSTDGCFNYPYGIILDEEENIVVVDNGNHRVQVFDSTGQFLRKFGSSESVTGGVPGNLSHPDFVALDQSGNIAVTEWGNRRISYFSSTGTFLFRSSFTQFGKPVGITFAGYMIVTDEEKHCIFVFALI